MDELDRLLDEILNIDLEQIVLSNTRDAAQGTRLRVRPVLLKGELFFRRRSIGAHRFFMKICRKAR